MQVKIYFLFLFLISNKILSQNKANAYFAGGCFWCVEAIFETVRGVDYAESGYCGGQESNPTYEDVSQGRTGHAETVRVVYDPNEITYNELVIVFFNAHDPSTLNSQGPDVGKQYRSAIFYNNQSEKDIIENYINFLLAKNKHERITTEVIKFENFYKAEYYHQDFEKNNPNNPYVRKISIPRLLKFKRKSKSYLKSKV
jgi:peptide-methionine (S)-S-oxide reductase